MPLPQNLQIPHRNIDYRPSQKKIPVAACAAPGSEVEKPSVSVVFAFHSLARPLDVAVRITYDVPAHRSPVTVSIAANMAPTIDRRAIVANPLVMPLCAIVAVLVALGAVAAPCDGIAILVGYPVAPMRTRIAVFVHGDTTLYRRLVASRRRYGTDVAMHGLVCVVREDGLRTKRSDADDN